MQMYVFYPIFCRVSCQLDWFEQKNDFNIEMALKSQDKRR